jgi:hypothetical protein
MTELSFGSADILVHSTKIIQKARVRYGALQTVRINYAGTCVLYLLPGIGRTVVTPISWLALNFTSFHVTAPHKIHLPRRT